MSGFDAAWLDLREPYDHRARNPSVTQAVEIWASRRAGGQASGRGRITILDLGAGTGSNLRFLAPRLVCDQHWILVDNDLHLLRAAIGRTAAWAERLGLERAERPGGSVLLAGSGRSILVEPHHADLATEADRLPIARADLVTASALLDLVSAEWLDRRVAGIAAAGATQYWSLTYDGHVTWQPHDPADDDVRRLVNHHQRTDKGFGPALGPEAIGHLTAALERLGLGVVEGGSDWHASAGDAALQQALLGFDAEAAQHMAPGRSEEIAAWRGRRAGLIGQGASGLRVGHRDVFASAGA